ncbi:unnamed protein product, partial [Adineta steineri]
MYTCASEVWNGLAKNAVEGLGAPALIVPVSALLFLGQIQPFLKFGYLIYQQMNGYSTSNGLYLFTLFTVTATNILVAYVPRILGVIRFRQDWRGAVLHPFSIGLLLAVQ